MHFEDQQLFIKHNGYYFMRMIHYRGARGGVVVKALCYKSAGRGFDSRLCHWNFSVT
jgi:hypothetical protein